ncbi:hypothetical protein BGZ61DRAFT_443412 [Ilyonectria robusta]|uniref:uncharacterized protein n=1 Tax=Ilyonectria robusta TaxID=1079257 RepID=UPI001E8DAE78|nr:uncharacterized protein BGZ61DRAFT_443412 [Ilyonectria robusta]KAH8734932.1 hypothetical protein BGZ61DRAFT_443412 [Ilyonectria robusta]
MLLYPPRSVRSLDSNLDLITLYSFQPPISLPPSLSLSILYMSAITMPLVVSLRCFLLRITRTIWNGHVPFLFLCVFFFAVLPTSFSGL